VGLPAKGSKSSKGTKKPGHSFSWLSWFRVLVSFVVGAFLVRHQHIPHAAETVTKLRLELPSDRLASQDGESSLLGGLRGRG
jgi:hypothetical protein